MSEEQAMTEETTTGVRTPWHLWVIGVLALLWDATGAFDYLMTQTENQGYMSQFTPEQLEFFYGFPAWVVAFWAIAVWGGLLASIFLLLRKRYAVPTFLVSFLAMVVTMIRNYLFADGMAVSGVGNFIFSLVIFAFAFLLYLYARAMRGRGVLT